MKHVIRLFAAIAITGALWGAAYGLIWLGHAYGDAFIVVALAVFMVAGIWWALSA